MVSRPQRLHKSGRISNSSKIYKMFLFLILPLTAILVPSASSEAYCPDGKLEKSITDDILDLINKQRSTLARGKLDDGTAAKYPKADAMNKLEWGCNLEEKAIQKLGIDCTRTTTPEPVTDKSGSTTKAALYHDGLDKLGVPPSSVVYQWLLEHKAAAQATDPGSTQVIRASGDTSFEHFADLMNEKTTKIGCAELICKNGRRPLLCLTNQPPIDNTGSGVIYTINATKACSGCKKNRPCNKETKLCEAPEQSTTEATTEAATTTTTTATTETTTKATTTATTETTTKATTKATTETTTTTAKATTTTEASYPGELPTGTNTRCPSNVGMTDELRMHFLDTQNYRRSILAKGQVQRPNGNYLPTGANIIKLDLNCSLENEAIKEVRECPTSKPRNPNTDMYGKNFDTFASSAVVPTYRDAIKKAVTNWWKVVRTGTNVPGMQVTFRLSHVNQPVESFTQIAWANTRYIGCAIAKCSSSYTVICLYDPKGNNVDEPIYMKGSPCAACPTTCDSALGLCV
ncbi:unnamed protein product [Cylicocyclus nassatus]|uniref:SCP domain-containing protein n=1 Tax=Cylicocyclus nassatus TaxID=53992 RepID=A0AA36H1A6_CYLNA|nr:unnamed protein product [Cylicocyclus nassatus]